VRNNSRQQAQVLYPKQPPAFGEQTYVKYTRGILIYLKI